MMWRLILFIAIEVIGLAIYISEYGFKLPPKNPYPFMIVEFYPCLSEDEAQDLLKYLDNCLSCTKKCSAEQSDQI